MRPKEHIVEHSVKLGVLCHLAYLLFGEFEIIGIIGTNKSVSRAAERSPFGSFSRILGFHYSPLGMIVISPIIINEAVISRNRDPMCAAGGYKLLEGILTSDKRVMHLARFRGIIAKTNVRLKIYHCALNLSDLQVFNVFLPGELREKCGIPVIYMHIQQVTPV